METHKKWDQSVHISSESEQTDPNITEQDNNSTYSRFSSLTNLSHKFKKTSSQFFNQPRPWSNRAPSIEITPRSQVSKALMDREELHVISEMNYELKRREKRKRRAVIWVSASILISILLLCGGFYVLRNVLSEIK